MMHTHGIGARSVRWCFWRAIGVAYGLAIIAAPAQSLHAQDSCAAVDMSVYPCRSGEIHVNYSSTEVFGGFNYGYIDDTFYAQAICTGVVSTCSTSGGSYHFVGAGDPVTISMPFHLGGPGGTGTIGGRISSMYIGGYVDVATTVISQPSVTIDSSQTPVYGTYHNVSMCAAGCLTAGASISTVPFFTLGQARGVTLVYNEDRAHPRPFIYAGMNPPADGSAISSYQMSATLSGASATFTNGETTLNFRAPGNVPVRLGGQLLMSGSGVSPLVVNVLVHYSGGSSSNRSYTSLLAWLDESGSLIARGWTIAGVQRLQCFTAGCLVSEGNGSLVVFPGTDPRTSGIATTAPDHSVLSYASGNYTRSYIDGTTVTLDGSTGLMTVATDQVGRTSTFAYDGSGRLTDIKDPRRASGVGVPYIHLAYGTYGLASITETGGPGATRVTTVSVDTSHNLNYVTDPDGHSTYVSYNADGTPHASTDRGGNDTYYGYDAYGKLAYVESPAIPVDAGGGGTTTATPVTYYTAWQGIGVPRTATSPTAPYASATTDIIGVVQAPGGLVTQFGVTNWGQPTTVVDPLDKWSFTKYGGMYRARMLHPNGAQDTTAYDSYGRLVLSKPAGDSATYYHYNSYSQIDSVWGGNVVKVRNWYKADHTLDSTWSASGPSAVRYTYNAVKEVLTATDNVGHQVTYGYDGTFANPVQVILPGSRTTTSVLDVYGRDSVVTAPTLAAVTTVYDVMNRPTSITQGSRAPTVIAYDALNRTDVTDPKGNVTHTAYNAPGWPTSRTDPNSVTEYFRYDIAGRKTSWTNRRGTIMSYTYDDQNRMLSRVGTGMGSGISDSYSYSDDPYLGNIIVASNAVETDSIFHKPVVQGAGGADSTITHLNGARYRVIRPYVGSLSTASTMSISASTSVTFRNRSVTLDATRGVPSYVSDGFNTASPYYNTEALETQLYNPASGYRNSDYMSLHSLDSTSFTASALNTAFGRNYYYDAAGRINSAMNSAAGTRHIYNYDSYGELVTVYDQSGCYTTTRDPDHGIPSTCSTTTATTSYTYDVAGNRTDLGSTYYVGNRLALFNGGWYTYDADGNVSQKYGVNPTPHNQQLYRNPENRLDSLRYDGYYTVTYKYNALGQPVLKYRNGTLDRAWLWDGDALLAEFNSSNQRIAEYLYNGIDHPYAAVTGATTATTIQYHEQDELGNVLGTHTGTSVTESISYDPWGDADLHGNDRQSTDVEGIDVGGRPIDGRRGGLVLRAWAVVRPSGGTVHTGRPDRSRWWSERVPVCGRRSGERERSERDQL